MMLGNVERLKIVVRRFDFGSGDDAEANRGEDAQKFVVSLADQVARADGALDAGKRKVNFVASRAVCSARPRFFLPLDAKTLLDVGFELVELLADNALESGRRWFQPVVGDLSK